MRASLLCVLSLLAGCASFPSGPPMVSEPWPVPGEAPKPSLRVIAGGISSMGGKELDAQWDVVGAWRASVVQVCRDSGLFSSVETGPGESDLRAEVFVVDEGKTVFGGILWAAAALGSFGGVASALPGQAAWAKWLALWAPPMIVRDKFVVSVTFKDREGRVVASAERTRKVTTVFSDLLIPAMFFASPGAVASRTMYDLSRSMLIDAGSQPGWPKAP